jgi:hypothetical protein
MKSLLCLLSFASCAFAQTTWTLRYSPGEHLAGTPLVGRSGLYLCQTQSQESWLRSTDGVAWSPVVLPYAESAVAGGTRIVAVGTNGQSDTVWFTDDGTGHTAAVLPSGAYDIMSLATGASKWVAVCSNGKILRSLDNAATWEEVVSPAGQLWSVAYGASKFVATDGYSVITSDDGARWTIAPSPGDSNLDTIVFANGRFLSVSYYSTNGTAWTPHLAANVPPGFFTGGGNHFISWNTDGLWTSTGTSWTKRTLPVVSDFVLTARHCGNLLVATMTSGKILTSPLTTPALSMPAVAVQQGIVLKWTGAQGRWYQIQRSPDNATWTDIGAPFPGMGEEITWQGPADQARMYYRVRAN